MGDDNHYEYDDPPCCRDCYGEEFGCVRCTVKPVEEERDAARALLGALVAALPTCEHGWPRARCGQPATHVKQMSSGPMHLCDQHRATWPQVPWAAEVRAAVKVGEAKARPGEAPPGKGAK